MKTKVEATINIHFDNCCGEPMTLTHSEAIELYHQLGVALNYPTKIIPYSDYTYPSGTVLCGTTVK